MAWRGSRRRSLLPSLFCALLHPVARRLGCDSTRARPLRRALPATGPRRAGQSALPRPAAPGLRRRRCLRTRYPGWRPRRLKWDSRPQWLFRASLSPRVDALSVGLRIFREKPVLGSGPNTYPLLYEAYSGDFPIENIHPHNGYVFALDDTGLVGGLILLAGALVILFTLAEAYHDGDSDRRVLVAACAAAIVTLAVHALTDSPNLSKTALIPFAAVVALSLRLAPAVPAPRIRWLATIPRLLPLALVPLLIGGWVAIDLPHRTYDKSLKSLRAGDFVEASAQASRAHDEDHGQAAYAFAAGVTRDVRYLALHQPAGRPAQGSFDAAVADIVKGLQREPRSPIGTANLALALDLAGDRAGATDAAGAAMDLAKRDGTLGAVAGTISKARE